MVSYQPPSSNLNAILRAISVACTDAWCYAPLEGNVIRHCSRRLALLLGLDDTADCSQVYLSITDARIAEGIERLGLPANWFADQFRSDGENSVSSSETLAADGKQFRASKTVVLDDGGRPIGQLLIIRKQEASKIPRSVWHRAVEAKQDLSVLSPRESEILSLVSSGLTNKAAAQRAAISEKTVEKHRASIMRKLGVRSVAELIRRVTEANLLAEA